MSRPYVTLLDNDRVEHEWCAGCCRQGNVKKVLYVGIMRLPLCQECFNMLTDVVNERNATHECNQKKW